jgi:hypothetical protein
MKLMQQSVRRFFEQPQPTNNPYIHCTYELLQRLAWDLRPVSWSSRRKIRFLLNAYAGKKAVIICNGPSLLKSDLSLLNGVFTFGLNKINLLFATSSFRPSCIVAVNPHVIEQNAAFFNESSLPLFLDRVALGLVRQRSNVAFLHSSTHRKFARDCSMSVFQGATVTFVALQLAFHMGFREVGLIGCDHNFATKGPPNKEVVADTIDANHFDPNYFAGGVRWHLPDLVESEASYALARETYQAAGRRIVNCTEGGKLEVFPRMSLHEFVG